MVGVPLGTRVGTDLNTDLGTDLCPRATFTGTPDTILAAGEKKGWWRADQGITLNGSRVSGWSNIWGNGNLAQATASAQPLYEATGMNGRPTARNDTGARWMAATLASAIATGSRMYIWMYVRNEATATNKYFGTLGVVATNRCLLGTQTTSSNWHIRNASGGSSVTVDTGIAMDLNRHLVEAGNTASGVDQWTLSGTPLSSTAHAVTNADVTVIGLFTANAVAGSGPTGAVSEIVAMVGQPTAQQKLDMRRYFRTYYGVI